MKLNTKIIILITTALVLTAVSSGLVSTWQTRQSGSDTIAQIERLGQDNLQRIKADGEKQATAFREGSIKHFKGPPTFISGFS